VALGCRSISVGRSELSPEIDTPIGPVSPGHSYGGGAELPRSCGLGPKFLVALYNPADAFHSVADAFLDFVRDELLPYRRFVVNEHIDYEAATRLQKQAGMLEATAFLEALEQSEYFALTPLEAETFRAVRTRFRDWDDDRWTAGRQLRASTLRVS